MIGWNIVFNIYICNLKVSFWNLWVKLKIRIWTKFYGYGKYYD